MTGGWRHWALAAACASLAACATRGPAPAPSTAPADGEPSAELTSESNVTSPPAADGTWPQAAGAVLARNERLLIYRAAPGDRWRGIAARFLGAADDAWQLIEANPAAGPQTAAAAEAAAEPTAGTPLLVPLRPLRPLGVHADRVQTVPILCYHRLGPTGAKMVVTPAAFDAQMAWLVNNGYRVLRLAELAPFLAGERPLPPRSVVITFDDGYESVHRHAWPVLRKYGLPATVFVYTDFLGGGDALTWPQLQEMQASGLIDVQSHSKSHRNLIERSAGESDERYRSNIDLEMKQPRDLLERRLPPLRVRHLAYPFGDANDLVLDSARRHGYDLAATVTPGGNAFYAAPLLLRRTMIFGDTGLDTFRAKLQVSRPLTAP